MLRPTPKSTLFPYTTLFRSKKLLKKINQKRNLNKVKKVKKNNLLVKKKVPCHTQFLLEKKIMYQMNLRSEEHTSELQSHHDLVCRLLLEKKKKKKKKKNKKK